MSEHIVCLNYVPANLEIFHWADAVIHPNTTLAEIIGIANTYAWEDPLKIFLPTERYPEGWMILRSLWHTIYGFSESYFVTCMDKRCNRPESPHG